MNTNKYSKIYNSIIEKAKSRSYPSTEYGEIHHILPKSLGGSDSPENLVKLTAKEHAICHLLLVRMTSGQDKSKMACAAWRMMFSSKGHQRHKLTSRSYEAIKKVMAQAASERTSKYRHSEESKSKISESKKGKPRNWNPEWREKIRQANVGSKREPYSEEYKKRLSEIQKGKPKPPRSEEHCKNISASKKGKKIHVDPVTGRRYMA